MIEGRGLLLGLEEMIAVEGFFFHFLKEWTWGRWVFTSSFLFLLSFFLFSGQASAMNEL